MKHRKEAHAITSRLHLFQAVSDFTPLKPRKCCEIYIPITRAVSFSVKQIMWQFVRETEMQRRRPTGPYTWQMPFHRHRAHLRSASQTSAGTRWRRVSSCGREPFDNFSSQSITTCTASEMGRERWNQALGCVPSRLLSKQCITSEWSSPPKSPSTNLPGFSQ